MLTAVGSIAFDSVQTPFGSVERELGGSAVYSALAASRFTKVRAVGPVGDDFSDEHYALIEGAAVDTGGVQALPGRSTFSWRGRYDFSLSAQSVETNLNAFDGWRPRLSAEARASTVLLLAAMDPEIQIDVRGQAAEAGCVALDSMSYWIATKRDALIEAIRGADIVLMNDHEARELTEQPMLLTAAREIASWGPRAVVLRFGAYGCGLLGPGGYFSVPGYPLEQATDPTGSGDAFAGGFLGYLDLVRGDWGSEEVLRRAVTYGCVMSSFCSEDFGPRRLLGLTRQEIDYRVTDFRQMTHFEHVPLHPRPRHAEAPDRLTLERPGPTAGTRTYETPRPTPSMRSKSGVSRLWQQPHAFRRAVLKVEGMSRSSGFSSRAIPASFASSSSWGRPRMVEAVDGGKGRPDSMLYCVVAREAPRKVGEALRRQFADDPTVLVVVERREVDRRAQADRRRVVESRNGRIVERRKVHHRAGLRVAERRAVMGPSFHEVPLPRAARGHEHHIQFGAHVQVAAGLEEDIASVRLALAHQSGDTRAFEGLFLLWFDRVYTFFSTHRGPGEDVEEAINVAFSRAFEQLADYTPSSEGFRHWLGRILVSVAFEVDDAHDAIHELAETRLLDRWVGAPDLEALSWLSDEDLVLLVRQLPSPQREVVALHYVLGLDLASVAEVVDVAVREIPDLHDRALRFMSGCLTSLSRRPGFSGRLPMLARRRYYPVTTGRKRALVA